MPGKRKTEVSTEVAEIIAKAGGPTAVIRALPDLKVMSEGSLGRWKRSGVVSDSAAALELARLAGGSAAEQLARARRIAGLKS